MRNQESVPNLSQESFKEAQRNWQCFSTGEERIMTIRAIITVAKLSLKPDLQQEDVNEVTWLLCLGEVLADMALYDDTQQA